jgi:hypothetical protein
MSTQQTTIYKNTDYAKKRSKDAELIMDLFTANTKSEMNYAEVALCISEFRGNDRRSQPRVCELHKSGFIKKCRTAKGNVKTRGNKTLYRLTAIGESPDSDMTTMGMWKLATAEIGGDDLYNQVQDRVREIRKGA